MGAYDMRITLSHNHEGQYGQSSDWVPEHLAEWLNEVADDEEFVENMAGLK